MIYIHKGDDTDFNDNSFLTFNIVTEKDLTNWQAKFILNGLEKTFEDITSKSFDLHFSDEETSQFKLGKTTNELRLIDEEGKIKTVAKNIEISVTNEVIENESQLINLPILKDEGIDINISLVGNSGGSGGTVNHYELLYRDMENQHPISAITSLQETLDNKANKDEIPNVDVFITEDELTKKQDALISGTNIKTINNQSLLGEGDITIEGGLDYDDKSEISGWAMPSGKYVDLELGASGSKYTAPANGWFCVSKISSATAQVLNCTNLSNGLQSTVYSSSSGQGLKTFLPVVKGDYFNVGYSAVGATEMFRFVYAQGEV